MKNIPFQYTSRSPELDGKRVLVVGHRRPISAVLERLEIPFAVWHNKPIKQTKKAVKSCSNSFPSTAKDIRHFVEQEFAKLGPFTHVIAGTEPSVYVASVSRRALQARKLKDSIALRCSDKGKMKSFMDRHGVPVTDFLTQSESQSPQSVYERLGPKVVVKLRRSSGGRGLSIAYSAAEIAARKERGLMYEKYIDANEMSIETYVRDGEIQFTSTTNYVVKRHANLVPANVPADILNKALAINRQVIETLNLNWGLTHAEFYWTNESVLFGEVALRPPGGYLMECISLAHRFDAWEAFVANELGLAYSFPSAANRTAGAAMLHAGQGTVKAIENADLAKSLPTCVRSQLLVKPGDQVRARTGIGEVSAYGLFASDSATATESDLLKYLDLLRFEMESP